MQCLHINPYSVFARVRFKALGTEFVYIDTVSLAMGIESAGVCVSSVWHTAVNCTSVSGRAIDHCEFRNS